MDAETLVVDKCLIEMAEQATEDFSSDDSDLSEQSRLLFYAGNPTF